LNSVISIAGVGLVILGLFSASNPIIGIPLAVAGLAAISYSIINGYNKFRVLDSEVGDAVIDYAASLLRKNDPTFP
jgi:drug/metabolite transporter (DMT)-like permease